MQQAAGQVDEKQFVRLEAIINSMTQKERSNHEIISGSRRKRIADGSGTSVQEVNQLLRQYAQMSKMFKGVGKGGLAPALRGGMGHAGRDEVECARAENSHAPSPGPARRDHREHAHARATRAARYQRARHVEDLFATGIEQNILPVGMKAPEFVLTDSTGRLVKSSDLLALGPVILNFFRGRWCPYCHYELEAWRDLYSIVRERGGLIAAVSP